MYCRRRRPLARWLLPAFLFVLLTIPGQGLAAGSSSRSAQAQISHGPLVAPHLFTGNLRNLPAPLAAAAAPRAAAVHEPHFGTQKESSASVATPRAAAAMPSPLNSFKGLDVSGGGANAVPPDPVGDVGPNNYVQAVNNAFAVYSKTGTQQAATTFNAFFDGTGTACDANNQGEPTVVYDQMADRWIVADLAFASALSPPFYECIGVSKTSDPVAGGWYQYAVRTDDPSHQWVSADYPKMGIWPDGLYMTGNMFDSTDVFQEVRVWAFNRADLESGSPLHQVVADVGSADYFTLLPSNLRGSAPPAGSPNYLVSESTSAFQFEVWKFHPDYTGSGTTFTGPTHVSQASYTYAPLTVPEPSPGNDLDTVSDRLMMQNQYRNIGGTESLWLNHTVKTGATGPVGIQWAQLNVTGGTVAAAPVQQQVYGNVGSDGVGRWLGSLAVDKSGDMALGYSASGSTVAPDVRYAGRLAGDPLGTLPQGEASLLGGVSRAVQSGACNGGPCSSWGAYSSMTIDPDGCTFWYTNEYYEANGLNWQTRIGSFKYASCGAPPSINWAAQNSVDFDGDHKTDLGALYRGLSPQDSLWFALSSSGGSPFQIYFGATSDVPVPGDYNGDGKTDAVIFRPSTGLWYGPATGLPQIVIQMTLGQSGDIPIPGDYDGDGKTDPAIYRPSTGMFFAVLSGGGTKSSTFGAPGDVPVPRDYDGDGKTDFAIYRANASNGLGLWYAPLSGGGVYQIYFGASGDVPVPGDYNGDKKAEAVIFREASGLWYGPYNGAPGVFQLNLGGPGDVPIPGYYDNNLSMDPATYHKANGNWFALLSGGGVAQVNGLGQPTDVPVQKRPALAGGI